MTYDESIVWLEAHIRNIASAHGRKPEEVCDDVINMVCA